MKKRWALWMFGLYRPSTRARYREEFESLIDDLIDSGEARWHVCLEIASAGCLDRLRGRRPAGIAVATGMLLLGTALTLTTWIGPSAHPTSRGSTTIASVSQLLHPLDLPVIPQISAGSCPDPPPLRSQLPPGALISAPVLAPSGASTLTLLGDKHDASGTCEYSITYSP